MPRHAAAPWPSWGWGPIAPRARPWCFNQRLYQWGCVAAPGRRAYPCFEAQHEDERRKLRYSTERRVDLQIVVGLLVDRAGFLREIGCYQGNKAETTTIIPTVK